MQLDTQSATAGELRDNLLDARARTLDLIEDLADDQLMGPHITIINPLLWEIGHVAWFQEHWVMRHQGGEKLSLENADALYDSMAIPHDTRWDLPLPDRRGTLEYMEQSLERTLARLRGDPVDPDLAYFVKLATFHEDMHDEAFTYTRQTLGYPAPRFRTNTEPIAEPGKRTPDHPAGDVDIPGGRFQLGADPEGTSFVFDNEKWGHEVEVAHFRMSRRAVTDTEFAAFVDDRGYEREELWSSGGWTWKQRADAHHPVYWRRSGPGEWQRRWFDVWKPLGDHPIVHVNWFEADAYCRWAGRRLPSEPEREAAAAGTRGRKRKYPWGHEEPSPSRANIDGWSMGPSAAALAEGDTPEGCAQLIGNAWEWTSTPFAPYPGFVPDPYKDYSEPWMDGKHMVLRGGAWPTRARMLRNTWRNFYTRDRRDVFAGFRTCAL